MRTILISLPALALLILVSCRDAVESKPIREHQFDYLAFDKKVAAIRAYYKAHSEEDLDTIASMLADSLRWSPADFNGNQWLGKEELLATLNTYHLTYENIRFKEGIHIPDGTGIGFWSGSIFPEEAAHYSPVTIRVYGTWTATHTATGKEVGIKFFSMITFNDAGRIVQCSDYFDTSSLISLDL